MSHRQRSALFPMYLSFVLLLLGLSAFKLALGTNLSLLTQDHFLLVQLGWDWLHGGAFPVHGTLSSVAAYNFPMLVWFNLPTLAVTNDPPLSLQLSAFTLNLVGTAAIFAILRRDWGAGIAWLGTALIALSPVGISGSYDLWAQQFLPTFFALIYLALRRWKATQSGFWLALSGILAAIATMMHFSALAILPGMLGFALVSRARWRWGALLIGLLVVFGLALPYLMFQAERNFADLRQLIQRQASAPYSTDSRYTWLMPEAGPLPWDIPSPTDTAPEPIVDDYPGIRITDETPSLLRRLASGYNLVLELLWRVRLGASISQGALADVFNTLLWLGALSSLWFIRKQARFRYVWAFLAPYILLMFALRIAPYGAATYYYGLQGIVPWLALVAYAEWLRRIPRHMAILALLVAFISIGNIAYTLQTYQEVQSSDYDVQLYNWRSYPIKQATDWIARDWQVTHPNETSLSISYDVFSENRAFWWVMAMHDVDARYRIGAPYDMLLMLNHGLDNRNHDAIGRIENADYVITHTPGLARNPHYLEVARFDSILILKPIAGADP